MEPLTGTKELVVAQEDTAEALGSGFLPVLATPRLVALMEEAACNALAAALPQVQTTVGTRIDIQHTSATPLGMRVSVAATCTGIQGRVYTFAIEAFDEAGPIGTAHHERVAVDIARFMGKVEAKQPCR